MVPSLGEGCNTALESALVLSEQVAKEISKGDSSRSAVRGVGTVSCDNLSAAFHEFSRVRLPAAHKVQAESAQAARAMTNSALADLKKSESKQQSA